MATLRAAAIAAVLAAMAAHPGTASAAATAFCDDFAANTAVPGNGANNCGDLFRAGTGVDNGAVVGATFIRPFLFVKADPDGRFDGNIAGSTGDLGVLSGLPAGTIFLDRSGVFGAHAFGSLTLARTQTRQSNQKAVGGMWFYDPQGSGYVPSIIGVKSGADMYSFWDVTDARTLVDGIWEGYWSTEGLVKDNGNFAGLSYLTVYGVNSETSTAPLPSSVPLPAAIPLFLGGMAGLGFVVRRHRCPGS